MATQRTFTVEEVQKKFDSLPAEVKNLLYSTEMTLAIQKAGEKNKLHFDQMGRLEMETTNVLLGFTDMKDYAPILVKGLEIDQQKATAVAQDIDQMLFSKIRGAMKTTYEQATAVPAPAVSQPAAMKAPPPVAAKSVVMPSSVARPAIDGITAPVKTPLATAPVMPAAPKAAVAPASSMPKAPAAPLSTDMQINAPHEADVMFTQPTVSLPKKVETPVAAAAPKTSPAPATPAAAQATPPAPAPTYKADPYREPIE